MANLIVNENGILPIGIATAHTACMVGVGSN